MLQLACSTVCSAASLWGSRPARLSNGFMAGHGHAQRKETQRDLGQDAVNSQGALALWSQAPAKENSPIGTGEW